ncbi:MAG: gliding motility-associated protein GldE, partial [Saprospiraceae bacterium]|nr:gliding motility-associated protein GldE [Saprospiraceae bacterium]
METEPYQELVANFYSYYNPLLLTDTAVDWSVWISFAVTCLLLFCSGLLSGSEVAFFSLTHKDKTRLREDDSPTNQRILNLLDKPRYLLSTILIANNLVNVAIILISNFVLEPWLPTEPQWLNMLVTTVLVTFLLVLFGEVAPKVYATINTMRIANLMSRPLLFFRFIFRPLSWFLVSSTQIIEKRLRKRMDNNTQVVSPEDIAQVIEMTVNDSQYAQQDVDMLKGIVRFSNTAVGSIMASRVEVVAVEKEWNFSEVLNIIRESSFSRLPVYDKNYDKVIGILYAKDLLEHFDKGEDFDWLSLVRDAFFVPEGKKIDDLFSEFKMRRTHMAVVVDEYGGTSGIVTMEDVLEEIVGEIRDEFDEVSDVDYKKEDDLNYVFEGRTLLVDVCRIIGADIGVFEKNR